MSNFMRCLIILLSLCLATPGWAAYDPDDYELIEVNPFTGLPDSTWKQSKIEGLVAGSPVDTTNFNTILTAADDTVQKVADTLDDGGVPILCKVAEAGGITIGQPVSISGASGDKPLVKIADNTNHDCSVGCAHSLGIAIETKTLNQNIRVMTTGFLVFDTSAWAAGSRMHLAVNSIQVAVPTSGAHVHMGWIVKSDVSDGIMFVNAGDWPHDIRGTDDQQVEIACGDDDDTGWIDFQNYSRETLGRLLGGGDWVIGSTQLADDGDTDHDIRFWFDKSKGAFRAGETTSTEWDDGSVGIRSVAFGRNTTASGAYSFVFGNGATASGALSMAGGTSTASATGAVALGGGGNTASANYSTAFGLVNTASGLASTAMGFQNIAQSYAQVALGRFGVAQGTTDSWVASDPVFTIGNGASDGSRNDCFSVKKNGITDHADNNITNVGNIALDTISSDGNSIVVGQGDENTYTQTGGTTHAFTLGSDAGDDFTIDGTGFVYEGDNNKVGIGTAAPNQLLHLVASDFASPVYLKVQNILGSADASAGILLSTSNNIASTTVGAILLADRTNAINEGDTDLLFQTSVGVSMSTKMIIKDIGDVIVQNGGKLQVNSAGDDKNIQAYHDDATAFLASSSGNIVLDSAGNVTSDPTTGETFFKHAGDLGLSIRHDSARDNVMIAPTDAGGNQILITNYLNTFGDHDVAPSIDPLFGIFSDTSAVVSNNEKVYIIHNKTGSILATGLETGSGTVPSVIDNYFGISPRGTERARFLGDGTIRFGDISTNYTEFETDGTIEFIGTATVFDDLPPSPIIAAKLGSTAPTLTTFVTDIEQYTFDATNDYVIGATEITHKWKEGTIIVPHIHWATNGSEGTAKGVQWQLKFTVGDITEAFSGQTTTVVDATIPASTPDRTHYMTDFDTTIDGANLRVNAYICWRLERVGTAHGNGEPAANPFGLAVGFHVEMDTMGSRTISTK